MRTFGKQTMQENEKRTVSRMKAYQKMAERMISRRRLTSHVIRRG